MKSKIFFKKAFANNIFANDLIGKAAKISFYMTLSIIPLITFSIIITEFFFKDYSDQIFSFLLTVFPQKIANFIQSILITLSSEVTTGVNIITILILIISSSKAADELLKSLAPKANKNFIKRRERAIILILFIGIGFFIVFLLLLFKNIIAQNITNKVFLFLYPFIAQLSAVLLIFFLISGLYYFAKSKVIKYKKTIPGAIFFTVAWIIIVNIFSIYLEYFLTTTLGNINLLLALILFIYISNIVLLLGNQLNNILE